MFMMLHCINLLINLFQCSPVCRNVCPALIHWSFIKIFLCNFSLNTYQHKDPIVYSFASTLNMITIICDYRVFGTVWSVHLKNTLFGRVFGGLDDESTPKKRTGHLTLCSHMQNRGVGPSSWTKRGTWEPCFPLFGLNERISILTSLLFQITTYWHWVNDLKTKHLFYTFCLSRKTPAA